MRIYFILLNILFFANGFLIASQPQRGVKRSLSSELETAPVPKKHAVDAQEKDSKDAQEVVALKVSKDAQESNTSKQDQETDLAVARVLPKELRELVVAYLPKHWRCVPLDISGEKVALRIAQNKRYQLAVAEVAVKQPRLTLYDLSLTPNQLSENKPVPMHQVNLASNEALDALRWYGNFIMMYQRNGRPVFDQELKKVLDDRVAVYNAQEIFVRGESQPKPVKILADQLNLQFGHKHEPIISQSREWQALTEFHTDHGIEVAVASHEKIIFFNPKTRKRDKTRTIDLTETEFCSNSAPQYMASVKLDGKTKLIVARGTSINYIENIGVLDIETRTFDESRCHIFTSFDGTSSHECIHKCQLFYDAHQKPMVAVLYNNGDVKIWNPDSNDLSGPINTHIAMQDLMNGDIAICKTPQGYPIICKVAKDGFSDEHNHAQIMIQDELTDVDKLLLPEAVKNNSATK
jgi:hypothetical protein